MEKKAHNFQCKICSFCCSKFDYAWGLKFTIIFFGFGLTTVRPERHNNHGHAAYPPRLGHASAQLVVCQPSAWQTVAAAGTHQPCSFVVNVLLLCASMWVLARIVHPPSFCCPLGLTLQLVSENWCKICPPLHRNPTCNGSVRDWQQAWCGKKTIHDSSNCPKTTNWLIFVKMYQWFWITAQNQHYTMCWQIGVNSRQQWIVNKQLGSQPGFIFFSEV